MLIKKSSKKRIFLKFKFLNYSFQIFTKESVILPYTDTKQLGYVI